jgi:Ca-activated chloride channel homolog
MTTCIDFKLQWDLDRVPAGQSCTRGLLIDVNAGLAPGAEERLPVNLALVLDRSGSMAGRRLGAAVAGTLGVLNSLTESDRLSVVAFDDDVTSLSRGQPMNDNIRQQVAGALNVLRTGGTTDLSRGWYEGASSAADVLGSTGRRGHVVVLSDGKANRGITDPEPLGRHVAALAQRGVTSSAVGIGPDYSPLQLDAIAEHGGGRLHHCDLPSDIVDVILGELGEVREIAATDVELLLRWPHGVTLKLLNDFPSIAREGEVRIQLGGLQTMSRSRRF